MSGGNIDILLNLWATSLFKHDDQPPFTSHQDLYAAIDVTPLEMYGGKALASITMVFNLKAKFCLGWTPVSMLGFVIPILWYRICYLIQTLIMNSTTPPSKNTTQKEIIDSKNSCQVIGCGSRW